MSIAGFFNFLQVHDMGLLFAVVIGVAVAWFFAENWEA